jgi:hypothetical protein
MKTDGPTNDRDESQPTERLTFAVFVVAELLCTGALIGWVVL